MMGILYCVAGNVYCVNRLAPAPVAGGHFQSKSSKKISFLGVQNPKIWHFLGFFSLIFQPNLISSPKSKGGKSLCVIWTR